MEPAEIIIKAIGIAIMTHAVYRFIVLVRREGK